MHSSPQLTRVLALTTLIYLLSLKGFSAADEAEQRNEIVDELENLLVELPVGKLRGRDNVYYYSYESIPYAEPPVHGRRFEAPQVYTQKWTDVFDATKEPVKCMQWDQFKEGDDKLLGEEDCLTVNIYKPKRMGDLLNKDEQFPVLIFIHGGAFMFGSVNANNHEHFMRSGRVMVVKISYRVGPLGFLSTEDAVIPGNFGLKDQRLALQWIKQHIAYFGGDPDLMMVLGFSAGGAAVHLHMLQQNFTDYATVAASFSGTALNPWVITQNSRARASELGKILQCPDVDNPTEIKTCLKSKSAEEIVKTVPHFLIFGFNPFTTFGPVIEVATAEQAFLTQSPEDIIRSGNYAHVPWLASYSAQDGGYNAAELLQKSPQGAELIEQLNERWFELAPQTLYFKNDLSNNEERDVYCLGLKQLYLDNQEFSVHAYRDLQRMYTDVLFKNGVEKSVRLHRAHSTTPIYAYVYDNPADEGVGTVLAKRKDIPLGTNHGDDFSLIFHSPARAPELRPDEKIISGNFVKMLEDFLQSKGDLSYGSCRFNSNVGRENLELMFITRDGCFNKTVTAFP